jgi:hypothetical protein
MPAVSFDAIRDEADISTLWGIAVDDLAVLATVETQPGRYQRMRIPKKGRKNHEGFRTVHKPVSDALVQFQKNLARDIADTVSFPDYVQGFVASRSAVTNAALHLAARSVLHLDITAFFDTITLERVEAAFVVLGCRNDIANLLARVCTLDGRLPQGTSTSPVLANLVCAAMDVELQVLAQSRRCRYSRYADDITVSGTTLPQTEAVSRVIERQGFHVNARKVRIQHKGHSQFVTGLSVSREDGVRAPRVMKRRLRLELHYAARYGVDGHLARIESDWTPGRALMFWDGWKNYLHAIPAERARAAKMAALIERATSTR